MNRKFEIVLALALAPMSADAAHPLTQRYLDGLFAAKPHLATFMGDHRFDGKLPDLSPEALKQREAELVKLQKDLAATKAASFDDQIDAEIMGDAIGLELVYLRDIRDWEWDPRLNDSFPVYDPREIVAGRLSDIIHGDFAPEAARLESVAAQLQALPRFLEQETAALKGAKAHPSREYVDQAITDNKGRVEFFNTELREFTSKSHAAETARGIAVQALGKYEAFLETELSKRADGDWRLGRDRYRKKFPLALQTDWDPTQAVARAEKVFSATQLELYQISTKLHDQLWPQEPKLIGAPVPSKAEMAKTINRVKDEIAKDHPKPDELVAAHGRNLDNLRAFIEKHDLLSLPPRDTLRVEPMPAFKRGSSAAEYLAPGVLDPRPQWRATYYVDPIDPMWPPDRVESYLRGQNNYEVQLVAAHEAYPGHHTQYSYARRNLNPLRAVLWNAAMVEGWAVYGEGLMTQLGWGDSMNDRFRFYDARGRMIVATNLILDVKLQSGEMSDAEAVKLMVDEGFQEQAMAEKKLLRAKLDSTQLCQYFLGLQEILDLERDARAKWGAGFTQRRFDEALIGHGSIAVRYLRRYVLK
jgi:uncharacterized protein (DUF885 family)